MATKKSYKLPKLGSKIHGASASKHISGQHNTPKGAKQMKPPSKGFATKMKGLEGVHGSQQKHSKKFEETKF